MHLLQVNIFRPTIRGLPSHSISNKLYYETHYGLGHLCVFKADVSRCTWPPGNLATWQAIGLEWWEPPSLGIAPSTSAQAKHLKDTIKDGGGTAPIQFLSNTHQPTQLKRKGTHFTVNVLMSNQRKCNFGLFSLSAISSFTLTLKGYQ